MQLQTETKFVFFCLLALFLMSCSSSERSSQIDAASGCMTSLAPGDTLGINDCLISADGTAKLDFNTYAGAYQFQMSTGCSGGTTCAAAAEWYPSGGQSYPGPSNLSEVFLAPVLMFQNSNNLVLYDNGINSPQSTLVWQSGSMDGAETITLQLFAGGYLAVADAQWSTPLIPKPDPATTARPTTGSLGTICAEDVIPNNQILPGQYFPSGSVLMSEGAHFGLQLINNKDSALILNTNSCLVQLSGCAVPSTTLSSAPCFNNTQPQYVCSKFTLLQGYNGNALCNEITTMGSNADHDFVVFPESYISKGTTYSGAPYVAYEGTNYTPAIVSVSDTDGSVVWNPVRWQSGIPALHSLSLGEPCALGQHQCVANLPCAPDIPPNIKSPTGYSCGYAGTACTEYSCRACTGSTCSSSVSACTATNGQLVLSDGSSWYYSGGTLPYVCIYTTLVPNGQLISQVVGFVGGAIVSNGDWMSTSQGLSTCYYVPSNEYLFSAPSGIPTLGMNIAYLSLFPRYYSIPVSSANPPVIINNDMSVFCRKAVSNGGNF